MKIILTLFILGLFNPAVFAGDLIFSNRVKKNHIKLLKGDLRFLSNFRFDSNADQNTLDLFETQNITSKFMKEWFTKRAKYIFGALELKGVDLTRKLYIEQMDYSYQNPNIKPFLIKMITTSNSLLAGKKGKTLMTNVGASLYYSGKTEGHLIGLKFKAKGEDSPRKIIIKSPRVGIFKIGHGLFNRSMRLERKKSSPVNKINRLSSLFHEARHGDGAGKFLGFFHGICPKGHDFEGKRACDYNLNGPYTVGAQLIKEMLKNCRNSKCSPSGKESLKLRYLDSISRVIKKNGEVANQNWDPTPEGHL